MMADEIESFPFFPMGPFHHIVMRPVMVDEIKNSGGKILKSLAPVPDKR